MTQYILAFGRKKTFSLSISKFSLKNQKLLLILAFEIFLILSVGIIYVIIVNNLALTGRKIDFKQKKISQLRQDNLKLQIKLSNLKSPQNLYLFAKNKNLISVKKINYIDESLFYLVKK